MSPPTATSTRVATLTGVLLFAIYAGTVVWLRSNLRSEIHLKIIERDAAVLYPMALQQVAEGEESKASGPLAPLTSLLKSVRQRGMLAVAVFDRDGNTVEAVPASQLFVELPTDDYLRLLGGGPITRYHPAFNLGQYFAGVPADQPPAPVLEVLLPLPSNDAPFPRGFVRYYIDARPLSRELATIDARIDRQTTVTLGVGGFLIALVLAGAAFSVERAQRAIAERNERLTHANFELTLAAKASAIGQITSHLIHGLQGPVEGLRAVVSGRGSDDAGEAWQTAADYTRRLQSIIQETVALLGDEGARAVYELSGQELANSIRERNRTAAAEKGVILEVGDGFPGVIDSHRGSLLCLIANNLVQNAIAATPAERRVRVCLSNEGRGIVLEVRDEGVGIADEVRRNLFKPGNSGRPGRSGLGLAISQLLARQIGAELALAATSPSGTVFRLCLPPLEQALRS